MIQPTALNFITVMSMVLIGLFILRLAAGKLIQRNPESELGAAIGALV